MMRLSDIEIRLCSCIAKRELALHLELAEHVAIPTGQNYAPGLHEYRSKLSNRLKALGATIDLLPGDTRPSWLALPGTSSDGASVPPTLIARRLSSSTTNRILLAGHLDTVHDPRGAFQQLARQPDGVTAIGPGVVDMKGGILVAVAALEALEECGVNVSWSFLLNSDEETGSFHSYHALTEAAASHDVGIAMEPALPDGSLAIERMGAGQFKIEAFGRPAHVGREFSRGVSAVATLARVITRITEYSDPANGLIVNVGPLLGGKVTNVVPDYAACWGNVRFSNAERAALLSRQFDELRTSVDDMPRIDVHYLFNRPAKPCIEPVRKLATDAKHAAEDLGQSLPFSSTGGVCDGNILQAAGLPTIDTLGVRGGNLHRPDEFIELRSLVERTQLLAVLLARLSRQT